MLSTAGRNAAADGVAAVAAYLSLHTADPGATGTSELTGGTPAYARQPATWAAASAGSRASTGSVTFNVPGGTTISHFGLWTAVTGGVYLGSDTLRGAGNAIVTETFASAGTYTLTSATITATT